MLTQKLPFISRVIGQVFGYMEAQAVVLSLVRMGVCLPLTLHHLEVPPIFHLYHVLLIFVSRVVDILGLTLPNASLGNTSPAPMLIFELARQGHLSFKPPLSAQHRPLHRIQMQ
jgi:hypothetical protein